MTIDLNNFTIEELYEKMDIQSNLLDLESGDEQGVRSGIATLSGVSCRTKRRDALYALCGYYTLEAKTLEDKMYFVNALRNECHYELYTIILQDLSQYKDLFRQKLFTSHLASLAYSLVFRISEEERVALESIVQNSVWGKGLKKKFMDKMRAKKYDFEDDESI